MVTLTCTPLSQIHVFSIPGTQRYVMTIDLGHTVCSGKWNPVIARYHFQGGAVFRNPFYHVSYAGSMWMMWAIIQKIDPRVMCLLLPPPLL